MKNTDFSNVKEEQTKLNEHVCHMSELASLEQVFFFLSLTSNGSFDLKKRNNFVSVGALSYATSSGHSREKEG